MADRISKTLICILFVAASSDATAMELDALLPTDIPGYGVTPAISVLDRKQPEYTPFETDLGGLTLAPEIDASAGYDTQPNGVGGGSSVFGFNPSLTVLDDILGAGAYVSGNYTNYPGDTAQDLSGYTVAIGEHAALPRETINIAAAALQTQETGFGLTTAPITKPIGVAVQVLRADDAIASGMVTWKPQLAVTNIRYNDFDSQNRTDFREGLTTEIAPGGTARFVVAVHATESRYRDAAFNADTYAALAGIADEATGIWNIRVLGGAAARRAATGAPLTAPVLEASVDWMPDELTSLSAGLAREVDDPDQEGAAGYTLSEAKLSVAHELLRNVVMTGAFDYSHAAYFHSSQVESLYVADAAVKWRLNRALALNAEYAFNDRQANFIRAANQHVFTLGVAWSP